MKATIGIYDNHDKAVEAVAKLRDSGFPVKQISILGKAEEEVVDNKMHVIEKDPLKVAGIGAGTAVGTALGILTGVGLFAIPGVGFLYGAGALVGAIAGFDFGLIGGGIATVLATVGVKADYAKKYHDEIQAGKFIVVAHGSQEEVDKANDILGVHNTHSDIMVH